jgi:hypothetical protein
LRRERSGESDPWFAGGEHLDSDVGVEGFGKVAVFVLGGEVCTAGWDVLGVKFLLEFVDTLLDVATAPRSDVSIFWAGKGGKIVVEVVKAPMVCKRKGG